MTTPTGMHVYTGRGGIGRTRARELRAAGIRGVVLCAEAVDGWTATDANAARWGEAAAAGGLETAVYAFPGLPRTVEPVHVAEHLVRIARGCGARTVVADVEAPYRGQGKRLVALLDAIDEARPYVGPDLAAALANPLAFQGMLPGPGSTRGATTSEELALDTIGITTLGLPSDPGTRWPWPALLEWMRSHTETWLGWQCYERARADRLVDGGIAELRAALGADGAARVVPHLATYPRRTTTAEGLDGPARLLADLDRACLGADGRPCVPGVVLWSDASLGDDELQALRAWTARAGW